MMSDEKRNLKNYALSLLAKREYSEKEILDKMRRKTALGESEINRVLHELVADGYLSDKRFAEAYVRSRSNKGFGWERIDLELREKGIDSELISNTLDSLEDNWSNLIYGVWRKKFYVVPDQFSEKVKQHNFLRYRGFRQQDIEGLYRDLEEH